MSPLPEEPIFPANFAFADTDDADELQDTPPAPDETEAAELAQVAEDNDADAREFPKTLTRRVGDFQPLGVPSRREGAPGNPPVSSGILSHLWGGAEKSQYDGPPPLIRAVDKGKTVPPWDCPTCNMHCTYTVSETTYNAGDTRNCDILRRPPCYCEERREEESQIREAVRQEEAARMRARVALSSAKIALTLPPRLKVASLAGKEYDRHKSVKAAYLEARTFTEDAARYYAARRGTWYALPEELRSKGYPDDPTGPPGLILIGEVGRGKSYLASAVCNELKQYGVLCRFVNCAEWIEAVRKQDLSGHNTGALLREAEEADVLVLDDMGTEHVSANNPSYVPNIMYRVINHRYERGLSTLYTFSIPAERLVVHYGERGKAILSRMGVAPILKIAAAAPDMRAYRPKPATEEGAS